MSQIHSDSDALRSFAEEVTSFARAVDEQLSKLSAAMSRLGNTWEDDGYREFSEVFIRTQKGVKQLMEEAKVMKGELNQGADVLDDYSHFHAR